ncbi:unnamed protein product [Lactuca saligna]|uniref:Uncharacterized protein n=1 Tax=Lactuca saligna TaxID=75948 RepID=A0AA35UW38_LACSI|nr:unnamed protein product [Lactuca saligna]
MAIAKVIREEQAGQFHKFGDSDEDDFRFSLDLSEEGVSAKEIDSRGWTVFPFSIAIFSSRMKLNQWIMTFMLLILSPIHYGSCSLMNQKNLLRVHHQKPANWKVIIW